MKNRKFTRIMAVVLVLVAIIGCAPTSAHASGDDELKATIEKQVRAFADSIDQSGASDKAAKALANHGISGGGKKLSVGKSHSLTATLFNSELLQSLLISGCTEAVLTMQQLDLSEFVNIHGSCNFYDSSTYSLSNYVSDNYIHNNRDRTLASAKPYLGSTNTYDKDLIWIAGGTYCDIQITRSKVTAAEAQYKVTCGISDKFDFSTSSGGGFDDLIFGLAAMFFKEFEWESKVTFTLKVPYSCSHSSGNYHWMYDRNTLSFVSDSSEGYILNESGRIGTSDYYFELAEAVHLYHDRPWVIEYQIENADAAMALSPLRSCCISAPSIVNQGLDYLSFLVLERTWVTSSIKEQYGLSSSSQTARRYYGTALASLFEYNSDTTYTFRLENEVKEDGTNMVYLSVLDSELGDTLLSKVPMNDYYRYETWSDEMILKSKSSKWLNGKDVYINYFGNQTFPFKTDCFDHFDLRIYENGEGGETFRYGSGKVKEPTCTAKGYTTYTCTCGYSYKADYVKALGHDYRAGICSRCGTDGVSAVISDGVLTLSAKGLEKGTHILLASYADGGRMSGAKLITWQGKTISEALPAAAEYKLIFTDGENRLLRNAVELSP